jgi:hypothetical protein
VDTMFREWSLMRLWERALDSIGPRFSRGAPRRRDRRPPTRLRLRRRRPSAAVRHSEHACSECLLRSARTVAANVLPFLLRLVLQRSPGF